MIRYLDEQDVCQGHDTPCCQCEAPADQHCEHCSTEWDVVVSPRGKLERWIVQD